MSRLLAVAVIMPIALTFPAVAQSLSQAEMTAMIEKQRRLVAVDEEGCVKYPVDDEIVVCGSKERDEGQRVFKEQGSDGVSRKRGEAVSSTHMENFGPNPNAVAFGYVPPPAIPFEEVMRGLPDQDMVVPEGSGGTDSEQPASANPR